MFYKPNTRVLTLESGLPKEEKLSVTKRIHSYRKFVYEKVYYLAKKVNHLKQGYIKHVQVPLFQSVKTIWKSIRKKRGQANNTFIEFELVQKIIF
jgi:hypothetical protein